MLKTAQIKNIRNIKNEQINFSPHVNIISGSSREGKSATLRAIILPILNRPSGYDYKPHKLARGESSSSRLFFDDCDVERERSVSINRYILSGDADNSFEAMGNSVPPRIEELINIPDYLIHTQHCGYFLIDQNISAGDVSRKINSITDLEIIDSTLKKINSIVDSANADSKYTQKDIKEKEDELKSFIDVEWFSNKISLIDKLNSEIEGLSDDISFIKKKLFYISEYRTEISNVEKLLDRESDISLLLESIDSCKKLSNECEKLGKAISSIKNEKKELADIEKLLDRESDISLLLKAIDSCKKLSGEILNIEKSIKNISNLNSDIKKINSDIVFIESEIKEKMKDVKECPLLELGGCPMERK